MRPIRAAVGMAAALALLGAAVAAWLWYSVYADRARPVVATRVVIERGSTFAEVARTLYDAGIIGDVAIFRIAARLRGQESAVRAGEYRFEPHRTQSEVLHQLVTGGAQVAAWVTIPEGFTAAQIAGRLESAGLGSADGFLWESLRRRLVLFGVTTKNLEGFLFPSTYLVPLGASPSQIAGMMTGEFFAMLPRDARSRAAALHVSVPQAVAVASLVEREAKNASDRPRIAEVIYNRLRIGMPLQVDATIEYALPAHKAELSFGDLRVNSPYNTYIHAGLPPTPIANPGRLSVEAALRPSKGNDLYYVYCGNGRHVFAQTLAAHQANVARCLH